MTASGLRVQVCDCDRLGEKLLLESQAANASSQPAFFQDVEITKLKVNFAIDQPPCRLTAYIYLFTVLGWSCCEGHQKMLR